MTTAELRAAIEKRIEKESALGPECSDCYIAGAKSLLDLVVEMDEALKRLGYGIDCLDCEMENDQVCAHHLYETIKIAKEARQKLAAWAKGE